MKNIMARVSQKFADVLRQPLSPEQFSLAIAAGVFFGICPIPGLTTLICAIAAITLRLNMLAIQLANYAVYPAQLLLVIPFMKLGALLFPDDGFKLSLTDMLALWNQDSLAALEQLWLVQLLTLAAWLVAALPFTILLYFGMLPFFRRLQNKPLNVLK